ncbi:hypothetical protein SKAU_G00145880 [Synaphobranchus kaupii]|uniref:Uncharacterized protein n=1 Tax=Synaphobranchus kaupii TaxID=118154 RepID=A0A9Q1FU64_SYNKA|nr:hypothetical protein SKAU_G00145880 [Synaphobranchus kaupii]
MAKGQGGLETIREENSGRGRVWEVRGPRARRHFFHFLTAATNWHAKPNNKRLKLLTGQSAGLGGLLEKASSSRAQSSAHPHRGFARRLFGRQLERAAIGPVARLTERVAPSATAGSDGVSPLEGGKVRKAAAAFERRLFCSRFPP